MDPSVARSWLRFEALAVLLGAVLFYRYFHLPWGWFLLLFLAPDLALLAYLAGSKPGAWIYNLAHSYPLALGFIFAGLLLAQRVPLSLGLIWWAHIGFDRALGYGLKSPDGFRLTHLGNIAPGRPSRAPVRRPSP